jgi:alpha-tubulin suppressor-like RCC1 family protein
MNVTNLILQLRSKITSNTLDQQMVSKAIKLLELGAVESVGLFTELPDANANAARLYYVLYDGLYFSTDGRWVPISKTTLDIAWAWGDNSAGALGDNTITVRSSPVSVVGAFSDWCQVSNKRDISLGVRTNGTAWAWGCNNFGRLGDNTTVNKSSPVSVVGGFTDWCQVSAGGCHSLGVRCNGTLWAWGCNASGQLGDNTIVSKSSPVSVVGGFTDWCQVAGGNAHSLGVRCNGTAWAWGLNSNGQLGDNTAIGKSSPVSVVGGFTDWCQVSAGRIHSFALRSNSTLWAWGNNSTGALGDNTITVRSSPVSVVGGITNWIQVSAGDDHGLALRVDGTAWAWGCNTSGQLGQNTLTSSRSPITVVGGFTDWCQVSAGAVHSLGVRTNGSAWAWGGNINGRLGDNTTTTRLSPVSVVGGFTDWCQVSAGSHSLAIRKRLL